MPVIRGVLLDLSGTLHVDSNAIEGAVEAVKKLRNSGVRIRFLTNTSKLSCTKLLQQLAEIGFDFIERKDLVSSVVATRNYLRSNNLRRPFCIMEDTSDLVDGNEETCNSSSSGSHDDDIISFDPPHDCVVVGLAPSKLDYEHLNKAFRILSSSSPTGSRKHLIAINRGTYFKDVDGELSLGPGGFITALEAVNKGCKAVVMGKPNRKFFESALWGNNNKGESITNTDDGDDDDESSYHNNTSTNDQKKTEDTDNMEDDDYIPRSQICVVGDDVLGDIHGAVNACIGTTILVQTGKYRKGDEKLKNKDKHGHQHPTTSVKSIVEAVEYILEMNKRSIDKPPR